eukprot:gene2849-3295_t
MWNQPPFGGGGNNPNQRGPFQQDPFQQDPFQQHSALFQSMLQQPLFQQPPFQQPFHPPSAPAPQVQPSAPRPAQGQSNENLVKNPNFEPRFWNADGATKEFNSDPWEILETGGDGWQLEKGPQGRIVAASYRAVRLKQDLILTVWLALMIGANGPRQSILQKKASAARFCARSDCDSEYFMNVTLLDRYKQPLDHFVSGVKSAGSQDWQKIEHKFYNYPPGVCFIRFEDGTKDRSGWAGQFGAKMCQPTVKVLLSQAAPAPTPSYPSKPVNLLTNPSFSARFWNGNNASSIDFHPWVIDSNPAGYLLEREPQGTAARYPADLTSFDVWCISTSHEISERCQIVDLVQKGYSAQQLDYERPSIKVYEWFASRSDCEGEYFMKVFLLDQYRQRIPHCSFETPMQIAPSNYWKKEEHIFTNIPPGVRYVEFRDGGKDTKMWAGTFGAKMVGAFVGVLPRGFFHEFYNLGNSLETFHEGQNFGNGPQTESMKHFVLIQHLVCIKITEGPGPAPTPAPAPVPQLSPLPPKTNLIRNPNFTPRHGWNDNTCDVIDFHPWTVLANGGDGVILERTPYGSGASCYPPALGSGMQHCIATSHKWFRRSQTVDMYEHGFQAHMFQRPVQIYVCEWFTSRGDCIGEYEIKVKVLDDRKRVIPHLKFNTGVRQAPGDRWQKVDHLFDGLPPNARYVQFEDGAKDTRVWAGHYGARMVGASVVVGEDLRRHVEECRIL